MLLPESRVLFAYVSRQSFLEHFFNVLAANENFAILRAGTRAGNKRADKTMISFSVFFFCFLERTRRLRMLKHKKNGFRYFFFVQQTNSNSRWNRQKDEFFKCE